MDEFLIESRAVEPFFKNGYILACRRTNEAAIIDPGDEAPLLLEWLEGASLKLISILNTHAHLDHICGVETVKARWPVPVYVHPQDEALYNGLREQGSWFGLTYSDAPPLSGYLREGEEVSVGDLRLQVIHTPGHSPGSVCLKLEEHLFCGDLIFAGSVGRTDLPGGSFEELLQSIRHKVLPLGDDIVLHPGHGPETTVGRERRTNPFLTG